MQQIGLTIKLIVQTSSDRMFNTFCTLSQSKIYLFDSFNPSFPVCCIAGDQRANGITTCVVGNNMFLVVLSPYFGGTTWNNFSPVFVCSKGGEDRGKLGPGPPVQGKEG